MRRRSSHRYPDAAPGAVAADRGPTDRGADTHAPTGRHGHTGPRADRSAGTHGNAVPAVPDALHAPRRAYCDAVPAISHAFRDPRWTHQHPDVAHGDARPRAGGTDRHTYPADGHPGIAGLTGWG